MPEFEYRVALGNTMVARCPELETAIVLADALFQKYFAESDLNVTISRVEVCLSER